MTPKLEQQACRFLGLGRSGQDRALVRFEDLEPRRDVAGVMVEMGNRKTQFCPENGRGKFGDQFLGGIGVAAEAVLEIAVEPRRVTRPVRKLVCERRIVLVVGFEEFGWRHGDPVAQRLIVSLRAMVAQVCADMSKEGIKAIFSSIGLQRGNQWLWMVEVGEAVALVGIEHGIGLEHAPVLGVSFAFGALDLLGVALVKDCDGRLFALADLSAELLALAVGHPVGRGVATAIGHRPQPEGVHPAIGGPAGA